MKQVVIINFSNNLNPYSENLDGFAIYNSNFKLLNDEINIKYKMFYINENPYELAGPICPGINIIFSNYEFISPILEEKSKDYNFIELCIKENEFKFYNFDESLVYNGNPDEFELYSDGDINKEYYFLIYKFLLLTMENKFSNIKSAMSLE